MVEGMSHKFSKLYKEFDLETKDALGQNNITPESLD